MKVRSLEITTGVFMLLGAAALAYVSVRLGKFEMFGARDTYPVAAVFSNVGGLRVGAAVVIAGVNVGQVRKIELTPDYNARVVMALSRAVKIQEDSIAAIKTRGLIGEKYIEITPGGADEIIPPGGKIRDTQPAVDLEELLSKYVFGKA